MKFGFASTAVKTCVVFHAVVLSVSSRVLPGTRVWEALNYFAFANFFYLTTVMPLAWLFFCLLRLARPEALVEEAGKRIFTGRWQSFWTK